MRDDIRDEIARIEETLDYEDRIAIERSRQNIKVEQGETAYGLKDLSDVGYKLEIERETIETGFYDYDSYIEDWKYSEITVIFGRNGEGKTTFVSQIIAHCLEKKVKTFLYSGEMSEQKIQDWLYMQLLGDQPEHMRKVTTKYKTKLIPKAETIRKIKKWHQSTLHIFDHDAKSVVADLSKFFLLMEYAIMKGVKLFIIDNLMTILEENADSLYSDQANFVQRCKEFARDFDCHVVLLCHPNKEKKELKDDKDGNLEKGDISGTSNIGNKADNIIAVERVWDSDQCDAIVTSLKDRNEGQRKKIKYFFSVDTKRFYNSTTQETMTYGWQKIAEADYGTQLDIESPWEVQHEQVDSL